MKQSKSIVVTDRNGLRGTLAHAIGADQTDHAQVLVELEGGRRAFVPVEALVRQADGSYYLPLDFTALGQQADLNTASSAEKLVIPVVAEELQVGKREVATGGVRVRKLVHEHQEIVDEPLLQEEVQVERVPINQILQAPVEARYEGETLIIPVLEELVVVEKRLVLKEELRITKRQVSVSKPQQVSLRTEEVVVEPILSSAQEQL